MTEPATLQALLEQRRFVLAAHALVHEIELAIPLGGTGCAWQGVASTQYSYAVHDLYRAVVSTRSWLENARANSNAAIVEAEHA